MARLSNLASFSSTMQARFKQQREFIQTHQSSVPGLVQRVSTQCGCSVANVYSVLKGGTFNAEVINTAYSLVSAHLGHVAMDETQGHPIGIEGLRRLTEIRIAEGNFKDAVASFQTAVEILKAQRRIYTLGLSHIESWLNLYADDIPDQVAVEITEYLRNEATDPQIQVTPLSKTLTSAAAAAGAAQEAIQQMIENGEIGPDGFPLPPTLKTLQAWSDPDPEAPGQHVDEHGEPTYFLSLRDSNRWQPEAEVEVDEDPMSVMAGLKGEMSVD